jgi:hypothetical protein
MFWGFVKQTGATFFRHHSRPLGLGPRCVAGNNGQLPASSAAVYDLPDRLTKAGTSFGGVWPKALGS